MNRGDALGALALFTEDAVYLGGGCEPEACVGKAAIGQQLSRNVGTHTQLVSADLSGTRLIWRAITESDAIRAAGFDHVVTMGTMLGQSNLIADYRVWFDVTDLSTAIYLDELTSTQVRAPAHPEPDTKYAAITDAGRGLCADASSTIGCGSLEGPYLSAGRSATLAATMCPLVRCWPVSRTSRNGAPSRHRNQTPGTYWTDPLASIKA